MKINIDLTVNHDFHHTPIISVPLAKKHFRFNIFQDRFKRIENIVIRDKGLILQGNSSERFGKNGAYEFCRGNYCDCCGIKLYPYEEDCLCDRCKYIHYNNGIPWRR